MKEWMLDCMGKHRDCHPKASAKFPRRLVQLSRHGEPEYAKIYQVAQCQGSYTALSYCWGGPQIHATTKAVYPQYLEQLPYSQLPQTILDAFRVTRNLGLGYTWIDSLCIIQDDDEDRAIEISKMGHIYQNAVLTISAGRASTCYEGFLDGDFRPQEFVSLPSPKDEKLGSLLLYDGDINPMIPGLQPSNKRAWTLQETFLSPRLLIFTDIQVFWKCQTCFKTDGYVERDWHYWCSYTGYVGVTSKELKIPSKSFLERSLWKKESEPPENKLLEQWNRVFNNYTRRKLSDEEDKLLAIAAVAERFSEPLGSEYLAGLWRKHLILGLAWRSVDGLGSRPQKWRSPTWSWASIDGEMASTWLVPTAEVLHCSTTLAAESIKFGAATSAKLVVRGFLRKVEFKKVDDTWIIDGNNLSIRRAINGSNGAHFSCDVLSEMYVLSQSSEVTIAWCLALGNKVEIVIRRNALHSIQTFCLVLVKLGHSPNLYQRIGFYRAARVYGDQPNWFEQGERVAVDII
jgi:hypothetical protein